MLAIRGRMAASDVFNRHCRGVGVSVPVRLIDCLRSIVNGVLTATIRLIVLFALNDSPFVDSTTVRQTMKSGRPGRSELTERRPSSEYRGQ